MRFILTSKPSLVVSLILILTAFLASCTPQTRPPSAEDIQTAIAQTEAAYKTPTFAPTFTPSATPGPTNTPEPTLSPTPIGPITGTINTEYLNMRSGPSTMFDIIQTFVLDTELSAISRSPDSKWVEVIVEFEDEDPLQGWMFTSLLDLNGDHTKLPEAEIREDGIVYGTIKNADDEPISGIVVAVVFQNDDLDLSAEVTTGQDGTFEVYVPVGLTGVFDVQILAWDCESPVVNLNCELSGYIILEDRVFIALPQAEPVEFVFEPTELSLEGKLLDADGKAAANITILAERDDGSISYGRSDALGEFQMPISAGIWQVYAIIFGPYEEGTPVQVEVTDQSPEAIELTSP